METSLRLLVSKQVHEKVVNRVFDRACDDRTRGDGFKVKEGDSG